MRTQRDHSRRSLATPHCADSRRAFTRADLCAALLAVLLLVALLGQATGSTKNDSERAVCFSNLRQIGHAVDQFMSEHNEQVSWRTSVSAGGTRPDVGTKPGAAWYEFQFLSNGITHPRILACPSDREVKVATEFSGTPTSYITSGMRANATSYTLNLDAFPTSANTLISSDRNIRADSWGTSCSSRAVGFLAVVAASPSTQAAWTNAVHGVSGHVLSMDGSVAFTDTIELKKRLAVGDDNGSLHILPAR